MPLARHNVTPLYEQIAAQLRREMERGRYEPSGLLPSEAELTARYGVSRVTVRLAIGQLAEEGLVERQRGKGTFVKGKRLQHELTALRGFHDTLVLQGLATDMQLLCAEPRPLPAQLRAEMRTRARNGLFLQRLHRVDSQPIALASTTLPPEAIRLDRALLENQSSYAVIETWLGLRIDRARLSVRVEQAGAEAARWLAADRSAPVLVMERTSYADNGLACEHTVFRIRPERYEFVLDSQGAMASPQG